MSVEAAPLEAATAPTSTDTAGGADRMETLETLAGTRG
jgi:hypothetical protein